MLHIRKANIADATLLSRMGSETFYESYAAYNTPEDMQQYVNEHFTIAKLETVLQDAEREIYIAEWNGEPAGYLQVSPKASEEHFPGQKALCIDRIYVYQKYQSQKIGAALMNRCIQAAEEWSSAYIWLWVWDRNPRAISFYERWGFIPFGTTTFILGTDRQTDILMYKPITAG